MSAVPRCLTSDAVSHVCLTWCLSNKPKSFTDVSRVSRPARTRVYMDFQTTYVFSESSLIREKTT